MSNVTVTVTGPGETFSYEMNIIQQALIAAGVQVTIDDKYPHPEITTKPKTTLRVHLVAEHCPWGG